MHSPPVQPSSLEQVGHRLGDHHVAGGHGQRAGAAAGSRRATARRRGRRGARARSGRPRPRRSPRRLAARRRTPGCARRSRRRAARSRVAKPSGEARRLDGGRARVEGAAAEQRRGAARPDLPQAERLDQAAGAAELARRRRRPRSQVPSSAGGRDLQVAAVAYQASTSCCRAPLADLRRPSPARPARRASAASSPKRARIVGRLNHIELTNPPLRPLGPSPQRSASSRTTRASGSSSLEPPRGPHPGVAAADDDDVGAPLAVERRQRLRRRPGLLEPVALRVVTLRPTQRRSGVAGVRALGAIARSRSAARGGVALDQLALDVARLAVRSRRVHTPSGRAPRRWCCRPASGRARRCISAADASSSTGTTSSTRL